MIDDRGKIVLAEYNSHDRARRTSGDHVPPVGDPYAWAGDLLAAYEAIADIVPPLYGAEAEIVGAAPVVTDPQQYARASRHGLAGRLGDMRFAPVIFDGNRFRLAEHRDDQRGAEVAFMFTVADMFDVVSDAVAWVPETSRAATLYGAIGTLGLDAIYGPRRSPLMVHETILDWLQADEPGLFIIDDWLAAQELSGATVATRDIPAGRRLRARLQRHNRRADPPNIKIPQTRERGRG
jgi:hypothetical protein